MSEQPDKKIIVDEDWKTQVERERAEAEKGGAAATKDSPQPSPDIPLPPANLTYLATTLYYQALASLGLMPESPGGKPEKNLPVARHMIDMLEVLQQKTEGNRTADETADLEAMLHQLRMAYVQTSG